MLTQGISVVSKQILCICMCMCIMYVSCMHDIRAYIYIYCNVLHIRCSMMSMYIIHRSHTTFAFLKKKNTTCFHQLRWHLNHRGPNNIWRMPPLDPWQCPRWPDSPLMDKGGSCQMWKAEKWRNVRTDLLQKCLYKKNGRISKTFGFFVDPFFIFEEHWDSFHL